MIIADLSTVHEALEQQFRHRLAVYAEEKNFQWLLDDRNHFEAEVERLHREFQENKLEMPTGKVMVLSELFIECDRVLKDYKLYERHPGFFPKKLLEEDKRLSASLPSRIENVLHAAPPLSPIGDTNSDAEEETSIETEQQESIRRAAKAVEDIRNITEYLRREYGGMPPLSV